MPSFIIVGYVRRILGRGPKKAPSIREQPQKSPSWIGLKLRFSKLCLQVSFGGASTHADIIEFWNFLLQLKNQRCGSKTLSGFSHFIFTFERNYDVLKLKGLWILLNKKVNFRENESWMENLTHSFTVMNLELQLI